MEEILEKAKKEIQDLLNKIPPSDLLVIRLLKTYLDIIELKIHDIQNNVKVIRRSAQEINREFPTVSYKVQCLLKERGVDITKIL